MAYPYDYSYCYYTGDDSLSYISDPCTCYCSMPCSSPPIGVCNLNHSYSYYNNAFIIQQQQQQVSHLNNSSCSSTFQAAPEKTRRFSSEQIRILEEHFYKVDKYVSKATIDELSTRTQLKPAQIRIWFNNKRTRERH